MPVELKINLSFLAFIYNILINVKSAEAKSIQLYLCHLNYWF